LPAGRDPFLQLGALAQSTRPVGTRSAGFSGQTFAPDLCIEKVQSDQWAAHGANVLTSATGTIADGERFSIAVLPQSTFTPGESGGSKAGQVLFRPASRRTSAELATVNNGSRYGPADRRKPRLKASFQRRSARGFLNGSDVAIGSAWADHYDRSHGQGGQPGRGGHSLHVARTLEG
jgi:hypothetical protein